MILHTLSTLKPEAMQSLWLSNECRCQRCSPFTTAASEQGPRNELIAQCQFAGTAIRILFSPEGPTLKLAILHEVHPEAAFTECSGEISVALTIEDHVKTPFAPLRHDQHFPQTIVASPCGVVIAVDTTCFPLHRASWVSRFRHAHRLVRREQTLPLKVTKLAGAQQQVRQKTSDQPWRSVLHRQQDLITLS